jgi:hypothetical protein
MREILSAGNPVSGRQIDPKAEEASRFESVLSHFDREARTLKPSLSAFIGNPIE